METEIEIERITVPPDRKRLSGAVDLAGSMAEVGLINPISVTSAYVLIAGLRRLEAAKSLGWPTIACVVRPMVGLKAELAEIDENLVRNEPNALERADLLKRRKEVYEAIHPTAAAGASQAAGMNRSQGRGGDVGAHTAPTFAEATAGETGISPRTVQDDVKLATDLDDEAKVDIRGTPTADNKAELKKLAKAKPAIQKKAAKALKAGTAKTVAEAVKAVEAEEAPPAPEVAVGAAWGPWTVDVNDALEELRKAAHKVARVAGINKDKNKQSQFAHFITWTNSVGAILSAISHVAENMPGEASDKAPGYVPAHMVKTRAGVRGSKGAA